jgi:hypothetical protein
VATAPKPPLSLASAAPPSGDASNPARQFEAWLVFLQKSSQVFRGTDDFSRVKLCLTRLERTSWNKNGPRKISCCRLPASAPANISGHQDQMSSHYGNVTDGRPPAKSDAPKKSRSKRPDRHCKSYVADMLRAKTNQSSFPPSIPSS